MFQNKKSTTSIFLALTLVLILALTSCANAPKSISPQSENELEEQVTKKDLSENYQKFNIDIPSLKGENYNLAELIQGKAAIIDFFASWCPPCKEEVPGFIKLHNKYSQQNVAIIGIALDQNLGAINNFVNKLKVNYPVLSDKTNQIAAQFGVRAIPTTIIVDPKGNVVSVKTGFVPYEYFDEAIKILLQK
jgi:peroxiredoxin